MAVFVIKFAVTAFITTCMATLGVVHGQIIAIGPGFQQTISLLQNVNDTSTNMTSVLQETTSLLRSQLVTHENQRHTLTQMSDTVTRMADTQNQTLNAVTQMADTQNQTLNTVTQMADTQSQTLNTVTQMADTQSQTRDTLTEMSQSQTQILATLAQISNTQSQMSNTQSQMSNTQSQMANTFNQVAALMQMQTQQLQNMSSTMNTVVSVLEKQQETLENISQSLPLVLDQQATQIELLNQNSTAVVSSTDLLADEQAVKLLEMQNRQIEYLTDILTREFLGQNRILLHVTNILHGCSDLNLTQGYSGIYTVTPRTGLLVDVYCDTGTDGGGWTVFQRRFNGSLDFYRGWDEYVAGFGSLEGEFWAGLQLLHLLTSSGSWELMILLEDFNGETAYANYQSFNIGDEASNYRLTIGSYNGTAGDSMARHNNSQFTTHDKVHFHRSCTQAWEGAWWYGSCDYSDLNGRYFGLTERHWSGMTWSTWKHNQSLKTSTMMIRPIHQINRLGAGG
ncbi:uncharacterized protein [Amphiura filiformis]|uniref:uncharacterized protein n=1 Tax=Amphiura filiformis TaxID=82378 RepID=UPI003B20FB96